MVSKISIFDLAFIILRTCFFCAFFWRRLYKRFQKVSSNHVCWCHGHRGVQGHHRLSFEPLRRSVVYITKSSRFALCAQSSNDILATLRLQVLRMTNSTITQVFAALLQRFKTWYCKFISVFFLNVFGSKEIWNDFLLRDEIIVRPRREKSSLTLSKVGTTHWVANPA